MKLATSAGRSADTTGMLSVHARAKSTAYDPPSTSLHAGLPVTISSTVQPNDQMSADVSSSEWPIAASGLIQLAVPTRFWYGVRGREEEGESALQLM